MSAVAILADTDADAVVYCSGDLEIWPQNYLVATARPKRRHCAALRCGDRGMLRLCTRHGCCPNEGLPATSAASPHHILKRTSQPKLWHVSGPANTRGESTNIPSVLYSTAGEPRVNPLVELSPRSSRRVEPLTVHAIVHGSVLARRLNLVHLTTASDTGRGCSTWARDCRCGSTNKNLKLVSISVLQGLSSSRRRSMFLNTTPMMALHSASSAQIRVNRACGLGPDHLMPVGNQLPTWSNDACRLGTPAISRI